MNEDWYVVHSLPCSPPLPTIDHSYDNGDHTSTHAGNQTSTKGSAHTSANLSGILFRRWV